MAARFSGVLLRELIDIECPGCGFPFEVQIVDAACQVWRRCPCCRAAIRLMERGGEVHGAMEEIDSAVSALEQMIKGLFG